MPPKHKYRPYRKPKQDKEPENKPPVFGPEPPPGFVPAPAPRPAAARESKPAHSSAQHATTATTTEATGPDAASTEQVHGQADGNRHQYRSDGGGRGAGRGGRGGRGGGRGRGRGGGGEGQYRRKKLPRKRIDDKAGGWDEDHLERPLDEADQDRYSEDLPWDLRLLRCCDEFRSLRSLGQHSYKVNYESVLRYFRVNITSLRQKYGRQPLRGYDPDAGLEQGEDEGDKDDDDDGSGEDSDDAADEEEAVEAREVTEQEWAGMMFKEKRLAKFFSNRSADNYTPTLWIAPMIMKSLLRFMLQRQVFPAHKAAIEVLLPVCDIAKAQLLPASRILKQICGSSLLVPAVSTLFPNTDSQLVSPIVEKPDPKPEEPVDLPDMFSNVSLAGGPESDDEGIANRSAPASEIITWATEASVQQAEEAKPEDPEEAMRARAERIKKELEQAAQRIEAWTKPPTNQEPATSVLKTVLAVLNEGAREPEGVWRVGARERSARTLVSWKSLGLAAFPSTSKRLVQVSLSPHEVDFPLTSMHLSPPSTTIEAVSAVEINSRELAHRLADPTIVVVDLALLDTVPDDLNALKSAVLEADLVQLVFVPSEPESTSASTSDSYDSYAVRSLWLIEQLYRVVPAYWRHGGELLRLEPGQQMSFAGPYAPIRPEVLARIMTLPESEPEDAEDEAAAGEERV